MSIVLATKPVTISEDLYNELLRTIDEVSVAEDREDFTSLSMRLQAVITIEDAQRDGARAIPRHLYHACPTVPDPDEPRPTKPSLP